MWIAQRSRQPDGQICHARVGVVTAQGEQTGVYEDGYQRMLPVAAPGGYRWKPHNGQQVLVIKTGVAGESACVVAQKDEEGCNLKPGEVELYGPGSSVRLDTEGNVALHGAVQVNGVPLESLIRMVVEQELSRQEGT